MKCKQKNVVEFPVKKCSPGENLVHENQNQNSYNANFKCFSFCYYCFKHKRSTLTSHQKKLIELVTRFFKKKHRIFKNFLQRKEKRICVSDCDQRSEFDCLKPGALCSSCCKIYTRRISFMFILLLCVIIWNILDMFRHILLTTQSQSYSQKKRTEL